MLKMKVTQELWGMCDFILGLKTYLELYSRLPLFLSWATQDLVPDYTQDYLSGQLGTQDLVQVGLLKARCGGGKAAKVYLWKGLIKKKGRAQKSRAGKWVEQRKREQRPCDPEAEPGKIPQESVGKEKESQKTRGSIKDTRVISLPKPAQANHQLQGMVWPSAAI